MADDNPAGAVPVPVTPPITPDIKPQDSQSAAGNVNPSVTATPAQATPATGPIPGNSAAAAAYPVPSAEPNPAASPVPAAETLTPVPSVPLAEAAEQKPSVPSPDLTIPAAVTSATGPLTGVTTVGSTDGISSVANAPSALGMGTNPSSQAIPSVPPAPSSGPSTGMESVPSVPLASDIGPSPAADTTIPAPAVSVATPVSSPFTMPQSNPAPFTGTIPSINPALNTAMATKDPLQAAVPTPPPQPMSDPPLPTMTVQSTMPIGSGFQSDLPPVPDQAPPPNVSSSELSMGPKSKNRMLPLLLIFLLLLVVGGGAYVYFTKPTAEPVMAPQVPEEKPATLFLEVKSPKGDVTAVNGEVLVSGRTLPNTPVLIYSDIDETSTDSDNTGNFEDTVVVGETGGVIQVIAFGENGDEKSETVEVGENKQVSSTGSAVLGKSETSPGQIKKAETLGDDEDDEDEDESEAEDDNGSFLSKLSKPIADPTPDPKVKKKIDDFLKQKTETKKTVKVGAAKIKMALTGVGTDSAALKGLKIAKLAAKQATPGAMLKRHAVSGVITLVGDGMVTVAHQIQRERVYMVYYNDLTIVTGKGLTGATGASLALGMRVAAVGEPAGDGILAKRIHVIPGKATGIFEKNPIASPSAAVSPSPSASVSATPKATPSVSPTLAASPTATRTPSPVPTGNTTGNGTP